LSSAALPKAVDASLIRADASKQNATPIDDWPDERLDQEDAPRAVRSLSTWKRRAPFAGLRPVRRER